MMWSDQFLGPPGHTQFGQRMSKSAPCSPVKPLVKRAPARADSFHVVHKVPVGDTPYVKAKHVQLVDKDPDRAIALFWAAINAGDRVDSALKDMAIVMKQQNRPQEAIEAIKSLRSRCSDQAQESLDNVLLDLYKRCGRLDDQIALLKHKLHLIHQGMAFNGKRTKTARSQGKKFQVSIEQEATRLLGNLGWAYMQQSNFVAAEAVYRKALSIEPDNNKVCNLGICLMKQGRLEEAKSMLQSVTPACNDNRWASDSHLKSYERAQEMLLELETSMGPQGPENLMQKLSSFAMPGSDVGPFDLQHSSLWQPQPALPRQPRRMARSNLEQQFSQFVDPSMTGALLATAGFGPSRATSNSHSVSNATGPSAPSAAMQQGEQFTHSQQWQLPSFNSVSWEEEDFDYTSPDENSDCNAQGPQPDGQSYTLGEIQQMQWHAEALRQRLESVSVLGTTFIDQQLGGKTDTNPSASLQQGRPWNSSHDEVPSRTISPPASEQTLSSSALPFKPVATNGKETSVAAALHTSENMGLPKSDASTERTMGDRLPLTFDRTNELRNGATNSNVGHEERRIVKQLGNGWNKPFKSSTAAYANGWNRGEDYDENRPTSRRSLSMDSIETPHFETSLVPQSQQNSNQLPAIGGLPPLHNAAGKRSRTLTPVKEKSLSPWGSLGFTHSPGDLDFGCDVSEGVLNRLPRTDGMVNGTLATEGFNAVADMSASEMEMKRQRRLRVFQEMTLTGSPQA